MKERIHYLDVTKGILITLVVMHHLYLGLAEKAPSNTFAWAFGNYFNDYIVLFFMPAFFVITGMCSNFGKKFKDYLVSNLIGLKAPVFFFVALPGALGGIIPAYGFSPLSLKGWLTRLFDTGVWFLHALFLAKIVYWFVYKIRKEWIRWAVLILLYIAGMSAFMLRLPEFGWCYHACALIVFLQIGTRLKKFEFSKRQTLASSLLFLSTAVALRAGGGNLPYITQAVQCSHWYDPVLILWFSTIGTTALLGICKIINHLCVVERIGRYTLVIYVLHGHFIRFFYNFWPQDAFVNVGLTTLAYVLTIVVVIVSCLVVAFVLDRPYLRIIIGKRP